MFGRRPLGGVLLLAQGEIGSSVRDDEYPLERRDGEVLGGNLND